MRATIGVGMLCVLGMALATARSVSAEWFGDLDVGGAFTGARDLSSSVGGNLRNVSFDTSGAIGARGGYWFEDFEHVGLALDALHYRPNISAQTVRTDSAVGPMRLSGVDVKVTAVGFDLMLRYPLLRSEGHPHGWLQPYFLVGPAQVASGIGFLGAGVILREGFSVRGLNTAATLWCSAAVGSLAGLGFGMAAVLTTGAVVITNLGLRPVGRFLDRRRATGSELQVRYRIEVTCRNSDESHVRPLMLQVVAATPLMLHRVRSEDIAGTNTVRIEVVLMSDGRNERLVEQIASRLSVEPAITLVVWDASEESTDY